jgi:hypothetical protein
MEEKEMGCTAHSGKEKRSREAREEAARGGEGWTGRFL